MLGPRAPRRWLLTGLLRIRLPIHSRSRRARGQRGEISRWTRSCPRWRTRRSTRCRPRGPLRHLRLLWRWLLLLWSLHPRPTPSLDRLLLLGRLLLGWRKGLTRKVRNTGWILVMRRRGRTSLLRHPILVGVARSRRGWWRLLLLLRRWLTMSRRNVWVSRWHSLLLRIGISSGLLSRNSWSCWRGSSWHRSATARVALRNV